MPDESTDSVFQQALNRRKREIAAKEAAKKVQQTHIPESVYDVSPESAELQRLLDNVSVIQAFTLWANKGKPSPRSGQTEGIKIRCPKPSHVDLDPSAWINSANNTWFCGGCWEGGDKYDIAAYKFGFDVPGYKGQLFPELKDRMAESLGFSVTRGPDGKSSAVDISGIVEENRAKAEAFAAAAAQDQSTAPAQLSESVPGPPVDVDSEESTRDIVTSNGTVVTVIDAVRDESEDYGQLNFPVLDWRSVAEKGSFLDFYMDACIVDDAAEEYHFWNGMLALGLAVGRKVQLADQTPVLSNLFLCVVGKTGDRKSRAFSHLRRLLKEACPYDFSNPDSTGTYLVPTSASGEQLIASFSRPIADPTNPTRTIYGAVRGLVRYDEFSSLTQRANRQGSTIRETLMEFYDGNEQISTASRTGGEQIAEGAFCSFFTTTQPDRVKDLIRGQDVHSGFINRWLFISGRSKKKIHVGGEVPDLSYAIAELKRIHTWPGLKDILITWEPAAEKQFVAYATTILEPLQDEPMLGRLDLLAKKLILLLCINELSSVVTTKHVTAVISMHNYIIQAYAIPRARIGSHISNEIHDEILRHVKRLTETKHIEGVSLNDLRRVLKRNEYPDDVLKRTLKGMVEFGELLLVKSEKKKGRPTQKYLLGD